MAIDLSTQTQPVSFVRANLHATPGNLDVVTLPAWCGQVLIRAVGTGSVILCDSGAQDSAASATERGTIVAGAALRLGTPNALSYPLRVTGTVSADPVEFILEPRGV